MDLREQIENMSDELTASERKLASILLADYPFAGLETIQTFAEKSHISAPSITRFVQKLGCNGYQEFQRRLISELKEGQQSPVDLRNRSQPVKEGFLEEFLDRSADVLHRVSESVTEAQFVRISALLADPKRSVYFIGGRISDPIAQYFSRHLRQIRRDVYHIPPDTEVWPEYLLRMRARDLLFMVDFRRYELRLASLAKAASSDCGAQVILITDRWMSPIARYASEVLPVPVESGTAWDTYCGALGIVEALITHVSEHDWDATRKRIGKWDSLRLDYGDKDDEA